MFDRLRELQQAINRVGLGGIARLLPAPRMALLEGPPTENDPRSAYTDIITDPDIIQKSRDLFESGFYSQAVEECYKFLDNFVKAKTGSRLSGKKLMEWAFSPSNPTIKLNDLASESHENEQAGYQRILAGSMLGIRNPCAHENDWFQDTEAALEAIVLAQHLLRKIRSATS